MAFLFNMFFSISGVFVVGGAFLGWVFIVSVLLGWVKIDFCPKHKNNDEEYRCSSCADRDSCPAADTGVCFPCHYFCRKKKDMGKP